LGIRAGITHFNCKKTSSNPSFLPHLSRRPAAPADGTGVNPADLTGVKLFFYFTGAIIPIGEKPLSTYEVVVITYR
jgi:hypothetical protein